MAVAFLTLRDECSIDDVQRGKQRRRTQPFGKHRQTFLRAISCLDRTLFVDRQHQGLIGRIEIEPHDIDHFIGKVRIVRDLERLPQMRL